MKDYGLVSIITPTWMCVKFIGETIRSVMSQTYQNWELLIQDDCSTDKTKEVIEKLIAENPKFRDKIKYESNLKNSGAAITRNNALRRAKGRWIAFLDSDDLWLPEKLEKQIAFMKENGYYFSRKPQYKGKSKLVAEKMLEYNIMDYKFFCFHGKPMYVELYIDRFGNHKKLFYDMDWNIAGFTTSNDVVKGLLEKPKEFEEMKDVALKLCKGMAFVRVDLYLHNGRIYFGEMTFCPAGGLGTFHSFNQSKSNG